MTKYDHNIKKNLKDKICLCQICCTGPVSSQDYMPACQNTINMIHHGHLVTILLKYSSFYYRSTIQSYEDLTETHSGSNKISLPDSRMIV